MNKKRFCIEREMAKSKGQRRKRIVVKETRPGRENLYESNKLLQMSATFFRPTPCPLPLPTAQLIDIETYLCASLSIFHLLSWFAISFFGIGEETAYCQEIWIIQHTIVRFLAAFLCYGFGQNASAMVINANELMKSRVFFFLFCLFLLIPICAHQCQVRARSTAAPKRVGKEGGRRGEWCEHRYCENLQLYYQTLAAHHMKLFNQKEELQ